jgi:hypothetical protein
MYVYINGVQSGGPVAGQLGTAMTPFYIGEEEWATGYFAGFISNVQVYNSSLDQSQIQTLYLEGIGGAPVNPQYLVGWWPLNGDTKDYSGYNNNGAPAVVTFISQYGK